MIDFGVGYQFNNWFRMDGTLEYRGGANLQSHYSLTDPVNPTFGGPTQFAHFYRASVSSFVGLVNGYVNLGTFYGVSPFVGAGGGFSENNVNRAKTNFAWALMAGLDINLAPSLTLEIGYRYLNYGMIASGRSICLAELSWRDVHKLQLRRRGCEPHLFAKKAGLQ